jgi:RimJ/RimL family protein N-acetyltransferase
LARAAAKTVRTKEYRVPCKNVKWHRPGDGRRNGLVCEGNAMNLFDSVTLKGQHVRLEPLAQEHCADLAESVQDGELWRLWTTMVPEPQEMAAEIERRRQRQQEGAWLPFAVIDQASGAAVGMSNFLNIDSANRRVEIGATWYRRRVQRSALNTECKLLLLTHAFETGACIAVEFRTHFLNHASRAAIERLGAKLDGVLRSHQQWREGTLRDTCVYSIVAAEWPAVRTHLRYQLDRPRAGAAAGA